MKGYIAIFFISLLVRLFIFSLGVHFNGDIWIFQVWGIQMFEHGFADIYYSDTFLDYLPGYLYVLWLIAAIQDTMGWETFSTELNLITFLPAIISDLVKSLFLYGICRRIFTEDGDFGKPFWIALAYSLNPAIIINSSAWGQIDAVHTMLLGFALYALYRKQSLPVYLLYGLAIMVKPHSLVVAPIFLYSAFYYFRKNHYTLKAALTMIGFGILAFAFMIAITLPFTQNFNLLSWWYQYSQSLGTRPVMSVNAFNFYALLGGNWQPINLFSNFVTGISVIFVTLYTFWILHQRWDKITIFFCAAMLNIITFNFAEQMHERYLFPSIFFLLMAAISMYEKEPKEKRIMILYIGFTITFFINCLEVLLDLHGNSFMTARPLPDGVFRPIHAPIALISFISVALAIYSLKIGWDITKWTETEH